MTDDTRSPPPPPPTHVVDGLKPGERPAGSDGTFSDEQLARMHAAASARIQAAMNVPLKPFAGVVRQDTQPVGSVQASAAVVASGFQPLGSTQFETPMGAPPEGTPPRDPATPFADIPFFNVAAYQAAIDHGTEVELILPNGRRTRVTKDELRKREAFRLEMEGQNQRWLEANLKKYGKKIDSAWDIPPPTREEIATLTGTAGKNITHLCATCKHSVQYAIGYVPASGFGHHYVSRSFCRLIEDPEGGNLEFEDSPIYYCTHHEIRWSKWAGIQLHRLEKRVTSLGSGSRLARVLKVLTNKDVPPNA